MSTSNVSTSKLSFKVAISKEKSNVLFAEADGDVVNILVSFLKLPLGCIIRILEEHYGGDAPTIGSLTSLYKSSVNLDGKDIEEILDDATNSFQAKTFVEKSASFIILEDLRVVPVVSGFLQTLNTLGINEIDRANITTVSIDDDDIMDLLKFSLSSAAPLTDLIRKKSQRSFDVAPQESPFVFRHSPITSCNRKMVLKTLLQKSTRRILLAEASGDFVEVLRSFLDVPLGGVVYFLDDNSCFKSLKNLYHCACDVMDGKYFNSPDAKSFLKNLPLRYSLKLRSSFESGGSLTEEKTMYIVRDDLTLKLSSMTSTVSILKSLGVRLSDVKEMDFQIGLDEALNIVAASVSSPTVLTDVLVNRMANDSSKPPKRRR